MKSMLTRVIKWSAIAALIGDALLRSASGYALLLRFIVVATAVVVLTQAAAMRRYVWMILFLVVAGLFNPVFPVLFNSYISNMVSTFALFLFFFSLESLKPEPRLSPVSITDRAPGRESL
jgi:flagellar biosynthesis protein FlhB